MLAKRCGDAVAGVYGNMRRTEFLIGCGQPDDGQDTAGAAESVCGDDETGTVRPFFGSNGWCIRVFVDVEDIASTNLWVFGPGRGVAVFGFCRQSVAFLSIEIRRSGWLRLLGLNLDAFADVAGQTV